MRIRAVIELARPEQWIKNFVVFMPVIFGLQMYKFDAWLRAVAAAAAFCFISSLAYILNDIRDRESDQLHPAKKSRPLASGQIGTRAAIIEALVLLVLALGLAQGLSTLLTFMVLAYLVLQICYVMALKARVLIDVICIALGFVLRAAAGAVAIGVEISPWLFICMFTICLFMGFCKRYSEAVTMGEGLEAGGHRRTLIEYSPELLTHLITLSAGIAVISFLLYGISERTVGQFGTNYFIYTLHIVVYAIVRFAMLSMKGSYADPTDLILHDGPFQITILVWAAAILMIICYGEGLQGWIQNLSLSATPKG
jgi:4-hydroxybenzoate polyprenyltransferase